MTRDDAEKWLAEHGFGVEVDADSDGVFWASLTLLSTKRRIAAGVDGRHREKLAG